MRNLEPMIAEILWERQERTENELRRMLGLWVNGLEPVIVYDFRHKLVGLSSEGRNDVIVYADPDDLLTPASGVDRF